MARLADFGWPEKLVWFAHTESQDGSRFSKIKEINCFRSMIIFLFIYFVYFPAAQILKRKIRKNFSARIAFLPNLLTAKLSAKTGEVSVPNSILTITKFLNFNL